MQNNNNNNNNVAASNNKCGSGSNNKVFSSKLNAQRVSSGVEENHLPLPAVYTSTPYDVQKSEKIFKFQLFRHLNKSAPVVGEYGTTEEEDVGGKVVLETKRRLDFPDQTDTVTTKFKHPTTITSNNTLAYYCEGVAAKLDRRLIELLILFAVLILGSKMVIVAVPYVNTTQIHVFSEYAQNKINAALDWSGERDWYATLNPLVCGLAVAIFSYIIVYLDSSVPGVNPPSPFSSKSKENYRRQRQSGIHMGYFTALSAGLVVSILICEEASNRC